MEEMKLKKINFLNGFPDFDEWKILHEKELLKIKKDEDELRELYLEDKDNYELDLVLIKENEII